MGLILHIDTSSDRAVIAIADDGKLLYERINEDARKHASTINMLINEVAADAGVSLKDIIAFSVIGGPGSYTGLRIGLATAKAFCYALNKPLLLINKLTLLALQQAEIMDDKYEYYGAILPAREKEYFVHLCDKQQNAVLQPQHIFETDLITTLKSLNVNAFIAARPYKWTTELQNTVEFADNEKIDLKFWCRYSQNLYNCNQFSILADAEPFYLKQVYVSVKA
ncbi:MAG TPA: tRNA (adenosine(37)-N6)-threonylcarbamoyltransferase complex dimerization subunit type 1 TsaB [Flavipsychrobacter sp.]|nr:tRNA (adenosine(37)-N6)-threonylcarbamoyltransferase complex dimerization subunit type 1 TsaB [Flavipsychrobacter sp.]